MHILLRKPSPMQMRAIESWRANGFKSKASALREAGYGRSVIDQPHKVFGSPVVIQELAMQGFDEWGRRRQVQALGGEPEPMPTPVIDFSKLDRKALQELKEQLGDINYAPLQQEEISSYVPVGSGADIFSVGAQQAQSNSEHQAFSSM